MTLERPDPDVVTAVTRSADPLREGRGLRLNLVARAGVRDAAAAWTRRVNTVTARTDRVDLDALLIRPDGRVAWAVPTGQNLDATTLVPRWAPGSANRPERRSNGRLRFAR